LASKVPKKSYFYQNRSNFYPLSSENNKRLFVSFVLIFLEGRGRRFLIKKLIDFSPKNTHYKNIQF